MDRIIWPNFDGWLVIFLARLSPIRSFCAIHLIYLLLIFASSLQVAESSTKESFFSSSIFFEAIASIPCLVISQLTGSMITSTLHGHGNFFDSSR